MNTLWFDATALIAGAVACAAWLRCKAAERRTRTMAHLLAGTDQDRALADWCRHMSLTVVTHTGSVYSTTLAELNASEASDFRNWNVPIQITLWSDLDDDARPEILSG